MTGMALYHFTDTSRLPWIVDSRQLSVGRNKVGGYPAPEFLWATSDPRGDGLAAMERTDGYRSGVVRQIRFTLQRDKFFPWSEAGALSVLDAGNMCSDLNAQASR